MDNSSTDGVSINFGVDFERAKERLSYAAGKRYGEYRAAKRSGGCTADEISSLWQAYVEASEKEKKLSRHDEVGINAILSS